MKIAVQGLGKMGAQIAQKLVAAEHTVVGFDANPATAEAVVQQLGLVAARDKHEIVQAFGGARVIVWLMIPAEFVAAEVSSWLAMLPRGSLLIDGGNSDFRQTQALAKQTAAAGCVLLDVGTSGGTHGLARGFCMMVGGDRAEADVAAPLFDALAVPHGAWRYFGLSGAGHFVKMVHNAIEYGMMESLAEGYRLLREGPFAGLDVATAGEVWQHGSIIQSDLNGLAAAALRQNPNLDGVDGVVAESGETRWALETARARQLGLPAIQTALDVRLASQKGQTNFATQLLAALRNQFGGHPINPPEHGRRV